MSTTASHCTHCDHRLAHCDCPPPRVCPGCYAQPVAEGEEHCEDCRRLRLRWSAREWLIAGVAKKSLATVEFTCAVHTA